MSVCVFLCLSVRVCVCCPMALQTRYRKAQQTVAQQVPWIPPVDNLLKDTTDGCALAALLHFYCPQLVRLQGTPLHRTVGVGKGVCVCVREGRVCAFWFLIDIVIFLHC